jgi:8-oxo-dGTP diphosphatase
MLCVDAAIEGPRGIVLSKRLIPPCIGKWHLPGGFVERGERLEQVIRRIALCETGLKVGKVRFFKLYAEPKRDPRGHVVVAVHRCKAIGGKLRSTEEGEVAWFKRMPHGLMLDYPKILQDLGYS